MQNNAGKRGILIVCAVIIALAFVCGVCIYAINSFQNRNTVPAAEAEAGAQAPSDEADAPFTRADSTGTKLTIEPVAAGSTAPLSVTDVVNKNADAVVLVTSSVPLSGGYNYGYGFDFGYDFGYNNPFSGGSQYTSSLGTGFFITADGYLLTNYHVVEGAESVTITLTDNTVLDVTVVGYDKDNDVAVLKAEGKNFLFCTLGDSRTLQVGQACVAIGNPLGTLTGTVTTGVISALERTLHIGGTSMNLLQHDAAINEGNSGGPLFDMNGNVIGINTAKTSDIGVEGLGFAIPISDIVDMVDDLIQYGYVTGRPIIGVTVQAFDENYARYYGVVPGLAVYGVEEGSGAAIAGIEPGDVLTEANGVTLTTLDDLDDIKSKLKVGDTITFQVYRDGDTFTAKVILQEDVPEHIASNAKPSSFAA